MTAATIAVYGATGHTGRLVAAELAARDNDIVLAGRDAGALHALADELDTSVGVRVAALDDPAALRTVTENVAVMINCAGPFSRSGDPVASAAVATGCHYLDHAAEPLHIKHLFDTFQGASALSRTTSGSRGRGEGSRARAAHAGWPRTRRCRRETTAGPG
jgi:short subunit dehydrogenase-like uncharacterized protein